MRTANILDPIHDTLDPRVWEPAGAERPLLKSHLKRWILREVYKVAALLAPHPDQWCKLVLTGSLTTYQYSDESDCDVSLFVNAHFLPDWDRAHLIGLMVSHMDGTKLPGTPFQMQCFVVPPSISARDLYQPGLRSGYDIESDTWLEPPDRNRIHNVEQEYNSDYVYALESADKMERLLRYAPARAVDYWHQIHKRRRRDQAAGKGDYSQSNIVYKFLANRGLFPELAQASGEYIAKTAVTFDRNDPDYDPFAVLEYLDSLTPEQRAEREQQQKREFMDNKLQQGWQPGQWGKGLWLPDGRAVSWTTGTRSLMGGNPHHAEVGRHLGYSDGEFHDLLRQKQIHLTQINPEGEAWECCFGHALPDEYYQASGHVRRQPNPEPAPSSIWD